MINSQNRPVISVIISTLNAAKTLDKAILSILSQSMQDFEILVVDGGSTDRTVEILMGFNDVRVCLVASEPDRGIYDAWNKALRSIKGQWVIFIGADDYFCRTDAFDSCATILSRLDSNVGFMQAPVRIVASDGKFVRVDPAASFEDCELTIDDVARGSFCHPGIFYKSSIFSDFGFFNPKFRIAGDLEYVMRVIGRGNLKLVFRNISPIVAFSHGGLSTKPKYRLWSALEAQTALLHTGFGLSWFRVLEISKALVISLVFSLFGIGGVEQLKGIARKLAP